MTAWRKDAKNPNQDKLNSENNQKLKSMIHQAGYGVVALHGRYAEGDQAGTISHVKEDSFGIIGPAGDDKGKLLRHMKGWGKAFIARISRRKARIAIRRETRNAA